MALRKKQDEIISFSQGRREEWKGLSPDGIRKAIRYARSHNQRLRLYRLGSTPDGWATYTEIPAEQWDTLFFGSQTEGEAHA